MTSQNRRTDSNLWKVIYLLLTFVLGGGLTAGGLQYLSPTNYQLQETVVLLKADYENYKVSRAKERELEKANIALELAQIKATMQRIEKNQEILENLLRQIK